jgi:type I restriction enzyme S subunit
MMIAVRKPNIGIYPWNLPQGWDWIALENLCSHFYGGGTPNRSRNEYFNGDIVWITPTDIDANNPVQVVKSSRTKLTNNGLESSSAKLVPPGTVLFSSRATIGKIAIAGVPLCTNQGFANLVCSNDLNNHYLAWCLRTLSNEIIKLASSTTYLEISRGNLRKFKIPIPYPDNPIRSLDIQRRIVARIETLLAEVKDSRNLINTTRQDAERLLSVALDEVFINLESVTDIVPFSAVATAFNGKAVGEGDSSIRVFKSKHIYPHFIRLDRPSYMKVEQVQKISKNRFLITGDVLMANAAEGTLGRVTYVDKCEDNWTVDGKVMILRSLDEQNVLVNKWLYYYLWSERGRREILFRRTGTAFAENRGQTGISPKSVLEIPVPKPPINQQRQVVAYLDHIQHEVDEILKGLEQDAKLLDLLEQSILERAFRGEL